MPSNNAKLNKRQKIKRKYGGGVHDEYYTLYEDIELELGNYGEFLRGKFVYSNCDDYSFSKFVSYFRDNFIRLGLERYVSTGFNRDGRGVCLDLRCEGGELVERVYELGGDGSFDSDECLEILRSCDVVVTNPPFGLLRSWFTLVSGGTLLCGPSDFIFIGLNLFFDYNGFYYGSGGSGGLVSGDYSLGFNVVDNFTFGDGEKGVFCYWYTSFDVRRDVPLHVFGGRSYKEFRKVDNFRYGECVNVDRVKDIPGDYYGFMAVPATFLGKMNMDQFELCSFARSPFVCCAPVIDDKKLFLRLVIRRKRVS